MTAKGSRRRLAVLGLVLGLMGTLAAATQAAATIDVIPMAASSGLEQITPGSDGELWAVQWTQDVTTGVTTYGVVRLDSGGITSHAALPAGFVPFDTNGLLHPLPDGSMGVFAQQLNYSGSYSVPASIALLRFAPRSGALTSDTRLPAAAIGSSGLAVAPDGAVWFARSCRDELDRVVANGAISRVRLPSLGCGRKAPGRELGAGLAFDVNGALWLVNLCMGRVDRLALDGRVREWWAPRISCPYHEFDTSEATPQRIVVDPHGGISYDGPPATAGNTRGRRAHGSRFPARGAGLFTHDGRLWFASGSGARRLDPDGATTTLPGPHTLSGLSNLSPTPTGGVALVRGSYWKSFDFQVRDSVPIPFYLRPQLVEVAPDGAERSWDLPDGGTDAPTQLSSSTVVLGPDGAQWMNEYRVALDPYFRSARRLVRVLPDDVQPPRAPVTRVRAMLARSGGTAWLQLACGAQLARFCTGTVTVLHSSLVRGPTRFSIAGGMCGAVPLRLSPAARQQLRRGARTVDVVVRVTDGPFAIEPVRLR
jgi:streptogramin lyase